MRIKDVVNVIIFEFGNEKAENKSYDSLEIYLHTNKRKKTFFITFLEHNISTRLNDFQISCKENYEYLRNLNLSESVESERNANVLMDVLLDVFKRKIIKGTGHATFLN